VAVRKAAELAELGGEEELMFERFPHRKTFFEELGEDLAQSRLPAEAQVPALRRAWSTFEVLDRVLADGGVAAMMPAAIEVR
jgi:hypothetical protein